jgi:hypothetical protein
MKEALIPPKRRFLQEPHSVTSQKMPFFINYISCSLQTCSMSESEIF